MMKKISKILTYSLIAFFVLPIISLISNSGEKIDIKTASADVPTNTNQSETSIYDTVIYYDGGCDGAGADGGGGCDSW